MQGLKGEKISNAEGAKKVPDTPHLRGGKWSLFTPQDGEKKQPRVVEKTGMGGLNVTNERDLP